MGNGGAYESCQVWKEAALSMSSPCAFAIIKKLLGDPKGFYFFIEERIKYQLQEFQ